MKAIHLSNRFWEILLYLILLLAFLLFSANQGYAQLKESEIGLLKEADALKYKALGGVYVGQSYDPTYRGWWVQYRKVMRIEQVSYDPNTGEKWYQIYYSQVIPTEYDGGHDPNMIRGGWLWWTDTTQPPWNYGAVGSAFTWTLKQGFPKWNPNNAQLVNKSNGDRYLDQVSLYSDGVRRYLYGLDGNRVLEYEWIFTIRWSQLPPNQLIPGQTFTIDLSGEAGGRLQNYHIGSSLRIDFSGLQATYDPPTTYFRNGIFIGRSGSTGVITQKAQRRYYFTIPNNPVDEISMTFVLEGWGGIVTYVWEKQPVF